MSTVNLKIQKIVSNGSQSTILRIIRDHSLISRSGIVKHSKLPLSAISRTVSSLLDSAILIETPLADTSGPRRKRGVSLNPAAGYCISVEYGPSTITGIVLNAAYEVIFEQKRELGLGTASKNEKIDAITAFIRQIKKNINQPMGRCFAVGLVDPGVIDEKNGKILMCSTMDDWENVPIVEMMEKALAQPVMLMSSTSAGIRAVDRLEIRNSTDDLLYIEYDEGIGCGMKLCGNYIRGKSNLAGEFGHIRVTEKPVPCRCGAIGCLEAVAALPALVRGAAEAILEKSIVTSLKDKEITGPAVLTAAANGDRLALRIVEEAFVYLGQAVGGLINTLDPEIVVFDRVISEAGEEAVATLMQAVRKSVLPSHLENLDFRISELGINIGALGGAVAILDYCLEY